MNRSLRCLPTISALVILSITYAEGQMSTPTTTRTRPPPSFPPPPDNRPRGCQHEAADPDGTDFSGLKVSIIIPYKNEKWEHIKSSLESILYYTPRKYLNEILFVSDGNGPDTMFLHELRAMTRLVSVLALPSPGVGLIEAKMRAVGAAAVESSVLVFLEPHIRVNRAWLQPMLRRIRLHPHVLAMPALDVIPTDNFDAYYPGTPGHWRFEWNLNILFTNPAEDLEWTSKPYPSPATSGGIFAIRRDWWNELGLYDTGMIGWGGDHVEATFKVWRCGGHIEVVPCSRIGHMFRERSQQPYYVEVDQVVRNYGRLASVWMDDHLRHFHRMKPEAKTMDLGNLTAEHALRQRLQCKDMSWYVKNVDLEMGWEIDHICIPGCSREQHGDLCCSGPSRPDRSTIDRVMSRDDYLKAKAAADKVTPDEVKAASASDVKAPKDEF